LPTSASAEPNRAPNEPSNGNTRITGVHCPLTLSRLKNQTAPAARSFNAPMIAVSPRRMIADPNELDRPVVGPGDDRRTSIFQLPDASRL